MKLPTNRRHRRRQKLHALLYVHHQTPGIIMYQFMPSGDPVRAIVYICEWWTALSHEGYQVRLVDHYIERGPKTAKGRLMLTRSLDRIADDPDIDLLIVPSRMMLAGTKVGINVVVDRLQQLGVGVIFVDEEDVTADEARTLAA